MFQQPLRSAILLLVGSAAASPALALGFGRIPDSIPFGQPLDLSVPLRLDGDAAPPPACLQAQVRLGDQRLPPGSLQLQIEGGGTDARVRLRSAVVVQEPTVSVQLAVGCSSQVSRQFVLFADVPPQVVPAETGPAAAAAEPAGDRRRPAAPSARTRPPASTPPARPRLALEAPTAVPAQTAPVDEAALSSAWQAAGAAQAAASAAERRLVAVTADLEQLREEAAAQRTLVAQMRARQVPADEPSRVQTALIAFAVSLGLVALWLGWRVRGMRRARDGSGWQEEEAEAVMPDAQELAPVEAPAPSAPRLAESAPAPAQGVDELIDLEQEVEFFVLLGDEHAAADLLGAHLRGGEGASPLPYLQLLEMHRRHQDRHAYEQVAGRFGKRFGTDVPGWDGATAPERELQDCPAMLAELQAHWASPAHAVAWLEQRLFSAPGSEMPGLPAYRDLLTLVAVARDLHRQAGEPDTNVDLLLPLAGGEDLVATLRPSIFDMLEPAVAAAPPEAAVDLDLSEPALRP